MAIFSFVTLWGLDNFSNSYKKYSDPIRSDPIYQDIMLGAILFLYWFYSLAQQVGFHFMLEKVGRLHISNGVWAVM